MFFHQLAKLSIGFFIGLLFLPFKVAAFEKLLLDVPIFPPYTYVTSEQRLTGQGVEKVSGILNKIGVPYSFKIVANHGVALDGLKRGHNNGFCLGTQNPERDKYGVMSRAVLVNDWAWFYLSDNELTPDSANFKQVARVGTKLNTNTYQWLKQNKYHIASLPNEATTLTKMLFKQRIDAVFLSADVFWYALRANGYDVSKVKQKTQSSRPFGCYFSNEYLAENPSFLAEFNQQVGQ